MRPASLSLLKFIELDHHVVKAEFSWVSIIVLRTEFDPIRSLSLRRETGMVSNEIFLLRTA
jgi:hypothetical protein